MKLIATFSTEGEGTAKVYHNTEWQEYVVKWFNTRGTHMDASDYHTDDKQDALDTAQLSMEPEDMADLC